MEPVSRSPSIKIDLTHTDLGRKQRQKITCFNRHKLRRLAIEQARDEQAYFRNDSQPERAVFAPTLLAKGTPIIELAGTASARSGMFVKWLDRHRCLVQITSGVGTGLTVISDWRCFTLQCEQLALF